MNERIKISSFNSIFISKEEFDKYQRETQKSLGRMEMIDEILCTIPLFFIK